MISICSSWPCLNGWWPTFGSVLTVWSSTSHTAAVQKLHIMKTWTMRMYANHVGNWSNTIYHTPSLSYIHPHFCTACCCNPKFQTGAATVHKVPIQDTVICTNLAIFLVEVLIRIDQTQYLTYTVILSIAHGFSKPSSISVHSYRTSFGKLQRWLPCALPIKVTLLILDYGDAEEVPLIPLETLLELISGEMRREQTRDISYKFTAS